MKVWIEIFHVAYEGADVIGVYSTREKAVESMKGLPYEMDEDGDEEWWDFDDDKNDKWYTIEEWEVD